MSEEYKFFSQIKQLRDLATNKSLTVSLEDFDHLIKIAEMVFDSNETLRRITTHQSSYGLNGCLLCRDEWMRSPQYEKTDHRKTCIASSAFAKSNTSNKPV